MDEEHKPAPIERPLEEVGSTEGQEDDQNSTSCCVCDCSKPNVVIKKCVQHDYSRLVLALILGQILSALQCSNGVTSQLLETNHLITVPTTQSFLNYILLGMVFGTTLAVRADFLKILWKNWWKYLLLGIIDVEANYMIIRAYEYTNLTTIQMLDSFTIACVMVLSFIFLRIRYKLINLMGISLAMIGIASIVLANTMGSRNTNGPNPLLGDLLCLAGSALYAVSNVAQEFLVKNHSIVEYLGLLGVSGSFVSAIQMVVVDREELVRIEWSRDVVLLFLGFGLSMFVFYSVMPLVMKFSSAVVVNLSLLTADIYTLFFGIFLFHYDFSYFYVVAFFLVITGVFIYNIRLPKEAKKKEKKKTDPETGSSAPKSEAAPSKEYESSSHDDHRRLDLRGLLESSNFESSTASGANPIKKKTRLHQRAASSFSSATTTTSEGSPLANNRTSWKSFESSSPTLPSSFSYGSISLGRSLSKSSTTSPSEGVPSSFDSTKEQNTHPKSRPALVDKATKGKRMRVKHATE